MEYLVQKSSLDSVADKIREVTNTSEKLNFPDGWEAALDGVAGSGGESGGGLKYASGTFSPEVDGAFHVTGLGFTPIAFKVVMADSTLAADGVKKICGASYVKGAKCLTRTNGTGTSVTAGISDMFGTHEIKSPDTSLTYLSDVCVFESGIFAYLGALTYPFKAGYTYVWEAWGE